MHFGKKLETLQYEPWAAHYLDYASLKAILERPAVDHYPDTTATHTCTSAVDDHMSVETGHTRSSRWTLTSTHLSPQANEFLTVLHGQLEKVILFVLQEEGRIAIELASNRNSVWQVYTEAEFRALYHAFRETGRHLLHLIRFVDVNVSGIRKIVKKFDKAHQNNSRVQLATHFWTSSSRLRASRLVQPLLKQNDSFGALQIVLETGMEELREHYHQIYDDEALLLRTAPQQLRKEAQQQQQHARTLPAPVIPPAVITKVTEDTISSVLPPSPPRVPPPPPSSSSSSPPLAQFPKQRQQQQQQITALSNLSPRSPRPMPPRRGRNSLGPSSFSSALGISSASLGISSSNLFGPDFTTTAATTTTTTSTWHEPILLQIHAARQQLDQTNEFVHLLAAPMLMVGDMALEAADEKETKLQDDEEQIDEFEYLTGAAAAAEPVDSGRAISSLLNLLSTFLYMSTLV